MCVAELTRRVPILCLFMFVLDISSCLCYYVELVEIILRYTLADEVFQIELLHTPSPGLIGCDFVDICVDCG